MSKPAINLVSATLSLTDRAKRLAGEMEAVGQEVSLEFIATLKGAASEADLVAGLSVVPAGVRDRARRLAALLIGEAASMEQLLDRRTR